MRKKRDSDDTATNLLSVTDRLSMQGFFVEEPVEQEAGDLIVVDGQGHKIPINVKSTDEDVWHFSLNETVILSRKAGIKGEFYILIQSKDDDHAYFIVPTGEVHSLIRSHYSPFLTERGVTVPEDKVSDEAWLTRRDLREYKDKWSLLDYQVRGEVT